ncbi:MAG: hypothetical protein JW779_11550, partial [Candidatus Thorarchaeota archaeon]|nr:hypothetical protein [Candidatus Thorarchaeota archaeon]
PFIVNWTNLDTRVMSSQKRHWERLCEVRWVSGQPHDPIVRSLHLRTYKSGSNNHQRAVQLCPVFQ